MMDTQDLSIAEMGQALRAGTVTAQQLARDALSRIAARDPALQAFLLVTETRALEDARRADEELQAGHDRGPLHGIPYALKDIYDTAGIRTTCHSKLRVDHVPTADSVVAARLNDAGGDLARQAGDARIRHRRPEFRPAVPALAESLEPPAYHWRLVIGFGHRDRRAHGAHGDGVGYRRVDPRSRRLVRPGGDQADLWPRLAARRVSAVLDTGSLRTAQPQRGGRGDHRAGAGRPRSARLGQRRCSGAGLSRRTDARRGRLAHRRAARVLRNGPGCHARRSLLVSIARSRCCATPVPRSRTLRCPTTHCSPPPGA